MSKTSKLFFAAALLLALCLCSIVSAHPRRQIRPSGSLDETHQIRHHLKGLAKSAKPEHNNVNRRMPTLQTMIAKKDLDRFFKGGDISAALRNSTKCENGEYCTNGACCQGGAYCCDFGMACCAPTCCQNSSSGINSETCCADSNSKYGGVCCENEDTKCCPADPVARRPSRCCPRWSICCSGGRFGCCDPGTGLAIEETSSVQLAHALLLEPEWNGNMKFDAATINLQSGNYTQMKVGSAFDTFGETPRSFTYDNRRDVFYLPQANFTNTAAPGDDPKRGIALYAIDGLSGAVTKTPVTGADDLVTGYQFVPTKDIIVMSTVFYDQTSKNTQGYKFYHLDPKTAHATQVAESKVDPNSQYKYDGWFHVASSNLQFVYRLGYQDVKTSTNFGVGVTDISVNPPKTSWVEAVAPPGHNNFKSLTLLSDASPTVRAHFSEGEIASFKSGDNDAVFFLSLAGSNNVTRYNDLDLFLWPLANPSSAKLIAKFPNAHTTPEFGPIQEALNEDGSQYTALVVCDSPITNEFDTWCLISATTQANTTSVNVENRLSPTLLAETVSVVGLGVPTSTKIWGGNKKNKK